MKKEVKMFLAICFLILGFLILVAGAVFNAVYFPVIPEVKLCYDLESLIPALEQSESKYVESPEIKLSDLAKEKITQLKGTPEYARYTSRQRFFWLVPAIMISGIVVIGFGGFLKLTSED